MGSIGSGERANGPYNPESSMGLITLDQIPPAYIPLYKDKRMTDDVWSHADCSETASRKTSPRTFPVQLIVGAEDETNQKKPH